MGGWVSLHAALACKRIPQVPRITVIAGRGHNPSATRERQQGPDFCPGAQEAGSHPEGGVCGEKQRPLLEETVFKTGYFCKEGKKEETEISEDCMLLQNPLTISCPAGVLGLLD